MLAGGTIGTLELRNAAGADGSQVALLGFIEDSCQIGLDLCTSAQQGRSPGVDGTDQTRTGNAAERLDGHHAAAPVPGISKAASQFLPEPQIGENLSWLSQAKAESCAYCWLSRTRYLPDRRCIQIRLHDQSSEESSKGRPAGHPHPRPAAMVP